MNNEPWYSVKSVYRHTNVSTYEERIVIFRAGSFDEAKAKGLKEATDYVSSVGQMELLKIVDVFHLFDQEIIDGTEVFSQMTDSMLVREEYMQKRYF